MVYPRFLPSLRNEPSSVFGVQLVMSTYAFRLTEPTSAEVWTKLTEALSAAGIKLNVGAELIVANDEAASGKATSALKEAGLAYSEVTLSRRSLSIPEMDCAIFKKCLMNAKLRMWNSM